MNTIPAQETLVKTGRAAVLIACWIITLLFGVIPFLLGYILQCLVRNPLPWFTVLLAGLIITLNFWGIGGPWHHIGDLPQLFMIPFNALLNVLWVYYGSASYEARRAKRNSLTQCL